MTLPIAAVRRYRIRSVILSGAVLLALLLLPGCRRDPAALSGAAPPAPHWESLHGPSGGEVASLVVDDSGTLFCAAGRSGFFYRPASLDHWTHVAPPDGEPLRTLHRTRDNTVLAGTGNGLFAFRNGWHGAGLVGHRVQAIAERADGVLLAGTENGIYVRWTANDSWAPVVATAGWNVTHLATAGSTAVIAAVEERHLFRAGDLLGSWRSIPLPGGGRVMTVVSAGERIWAGGESGLASLAPDGGSWITEISPGVPVYSLAVDGETLRAGVGAAVWRRDGDGTWHADAGELPAPADRLTVAGGTVWIGVRSRGVFRYPDLEARPVDEGLPAATVTGLLHNEAFVWAGRTPGGVVRTPIDNPGDWEAMGLDSVGVLSLAMDDNGAVFAGGDGGGIWRRSGKGGSWSAIAEAISSGPVTDIVVNRFHHILTAGGEGVFRSLDDGRSWTHLAGSLAMYGIRHLAVDSRNRLVLGTARGGVFLSDDNGERWLAIGLETAAVCGLGFDGGDRLWVATADGRVYHADAAGEAWRRQPDIAGAVLPLTAMALLPEGGVAVSSELQGVWLQRSEGMQWVDEGEGLPGTAIRRLLAPRPGLLLGATAGNGVVMLRY